MLRPRLFVDALTLEEVIPILRSMQKKSTANFTTVEKCLMEDFSLIMADKIQLPTTMGLTHNEILDLASSQMFVYEAELDSRGITVETM